MESPAVGAALEFWFELGSNYSYVSVMRIEDLARLHGVDLSWKPFLLGPIFQSFGWDNSPFVLQKEKGAYTWRDMERQCEKYGLPWNRPSRFPRRTVMSTRVAEPWIGAYALARTDGRGAPTRRFWRHPIERAKASGNRYMGDPEGRDQSKGNGEGNQGKAAPFPRTTTSSVGRVRHAQGCES
jgi:hypothetical protein